MRDLPRYEMRDTSRGYDAWQELVPDPEGDWVRWDDIAASPTLHVLSDVASERARQDAKWGGAQHDDSLKPGDWDSLRYRRALDAALTEDRVVRRKNLVQLAALAVAEVEVIDRLIGRSPEATMPQPSEALLRVAEACEGIVHPRCLCGLPQCGECAKALEALATLEAHAAAIRAGRVTITEEASDAK